MAFRYVVKKRVFGFDKSLHWRNQLRQIVRPGYERGYGSARRCKNGYGRTD